MGLPHLNYLVVVFVAHVLIHCFAYELVNNTRTQRNLFSPVRDRYLFNDATKKAVINNLTNSFGQFYWKRKRSDTDHNNKIENYYWGNLKSVSRVETNTATQSKRYSFVSRFIPKSSTPSYIEFDYLDEVQHQANNTSLKRLDGFSSSNGEVMKSNSYKVNKPVISRPSIGSYRLFVDPYINRQQKINFPSPSHLKRRHKLLKPQVQLAGKTKTNKLDKLENKLDISDLISNLPFESRKLATVKVYLKGTQALMAQDTKTLTTKDNDELPIECAAATTLKLTTPNDRVKFFEMYDRNTLKPSNRRKKLRNYSDFESQLNNNKVWRCNLNTSRSEKMYKSFRKRSFESENNIAVANQIEGKNILKSRTSSSPNSTLIMFGDTGEFLSDVISKTAIAHWSDYSFASVYVYKPTQTHCDAAAISPHWLLAAGSCLSRQTLTHSIYARSAFVTYCGQHWRRPERVAYVKRSVVHPKFNPKDQARRLLFNIGLIQVASSMASCLRWAPVALMSHHFSVPPTGLVASAVGWGLDRYGTKYMTEKLPLWPLSVYDALVYHGTCPGNPEYSKAKLRGDDGANNVYCLMLPPYSNEESDPVHGGLMLVNGKLVALYLQEERRMQGPQSAQYTGVWRLLPWVMDVAREPDDAETTLDV